MHLNGAMATRTNSTQGEEGVIHHFSVQITIDSVCKKHCQQVGGVSAILRESNSSTYSSHLLAMLLTHTVNRYLHRKMVNDTLFTLGRIRTSASSKFDKLLMHVFSLSTICQRRHGWLFQSANGVPYARPRSVFAYCKR